MNSECFAGLDPFRGPRMRRFLAFRALAEKTKRTLENLQSLTRIHNLKGALNSCMALLRVGQQTPFGPLRIGKSGSPVFTAKRSFSKEAPSQQIWAWNILYSGVACLAPQAATKS